MKSLKAYILFFLGTAWITINIYFFPFFAWTTGIAWSWMILHGLVPYRDFSDNRTHFDIFLLAGWSYFFGNNQASYQSFIYVLFLAIAALVFILSHKISPKIQIPSFIFYIIFLFPLFQNTEMDEVIVGLWILLLLAAVYKYLSKRDIRVIFLAGIISGISIITKQNSGGIVIATVAILGFDAYIQKRFFPMFLKPVIFYVAGISLPILISIAYLTYNKAFSDFIFQVLILTSTYLANPLPPGFSMGDGLWIEIGYLVLFIPFLVYWKQTKLSIQKVIFLVLLTISLFPSLLPSFLSYRAFTVYPVIAIIAGFDMFLLMSKKSTIIQKSIISLSFVIFIVLTLRFTNPYATSIRNEGFHFNNYIIDYGENDYQVADWVRKNTKENEKIMTSTSYIVYLLSNRLPKNKYTMFEPVMLLPYSVSSNVFISDPPSVFILEKDILETRPDLKQWPFFAYLKKNYKSVATYGINEIFVHK